MPEKNYKLKQIECHNISKMLNKTQHFHPPMLKYKQEFPGDNAKLSEICAFLSDVGKSVLLSPKRSNGKFSE